MMVIFARPERLGFFKRIKGAKYVTDTKDDLVPRAA